MKLKFKHLILITLLGIFSVNAYAQRKQYPIGDSNVRLDIDHKKSVVTDFRVDGQRFSERIIEPAEIEHVPTGARSSSTVPAVIEKSVHKKTVFKNLLQAATKGGKIVRGASASVGGPIGFAISTGAFYLVDSYLSKEGYVFDEDNGQFGKIEPDFGWCVSATNSNYCSEERIQKKQDLWKEGSLNDEALKKELCWSAYAKGMHFNPVTFTPQDMRIRGNWCMPVKTYEENGQKKTLSVLMSTLAFVNYKGAFRPITQEEFDAITEPKADKSPSQFVNATRNEDGTIPGLEEGSPTVQDGLVSVLGPVTTADNNVVQITINFRTQDGQTTATVTITPRNDLTPNSPTAPSTGSSTGGNTGGQTGNDTGGNTNGQTGNQTGNQNNTDRTTRTELKPKTDTGEGSQTDTETKTKEGDKTKEDGKTEQPQGGLLCEIFPDILACDKMGKPEEGMFDDITIPHVTDETTWNPDNFLPPNGVCPQPKSFSVWGRPVQISYEPLCVFMENVRFAVLLGFIIMSAFIVFGSLRKG